MNHSSGESQSANWIKREKKIMIKAESLMDYEIVNKKSEYKHLIVPKNMKNMNLNSQYWILQKSFSTAVEDLRFKIAMVNHFSFLFRQKLIFENLFALEQREHAHTFIRTDIHAKSGWVEMERKRIAVSVYSVVSCSDCGGLFEDCHVFFKWQHLSCWEILLIFNFIKRN